MVDIAPEATQLETLRLAPSSKVKLLSTPSFWLVLLSGKVVNAVLSSESPASTP